MNIDDMTIGDAKKLAQMVSSDKSHSLAIGRKYLVRATYHHIGQLVAVTDTDIVLMGGGWLADSGRFSKCLKEGTVNEFEALPDQNETRIVSRNDIIDIFNWNHDLPKETK